MDVPSRLNEQPPVLATNSPFGHDQYLLKRQLLKVIGASFNIYNTAGVQVLQANQAGLKLKEDIRIMGGPGFTQELVGIFARQIIDFSAAYDIVDLTTNHKIGAMRRKGLVSTFVRDEWVLLDPWDKEYGVVQEDSVLLGMVRRLLTNLVPQNYDCVINGSRYVDIRQNFNPFSYHLNIVFEVPEHQFDRRIGMAAAVLLAAIEGRQKG